MDDEIEALVDEGWDVLFRRVLIGDTPAVMMELRRGEVILRMSGHNSLKLLSSLWSRAVEYTPRLRDF